MAIKIQTRETLIPIQVGDLTFQYSITDESKATLRKNLNTMQKELKKTKNALKALKEDSFEQEMKLTKSIVKQAVDAVLGEGSCEQLYKLSPSTEIVVYYFIQIMQGLLDEISKMNDTSELSKYMQQMKK